VLRGRRARAREQRLGLRLDLDLAAPRGRRPASAPRTEPSRGPRDPDRDIVTDAHLAKICAVWKVRATPRRASGIGLLPGQGRPSRSEKAPIRYVVAGEHVEGAWSCPRHGPITAWIRPRSIARVTRRGAARRRRQAHDVTLRIAPSDYSALASRLRRSARPAALSPLGGSRVRAGPPSRASSPRDHPFRQPVDRARRQRCRRGWPIVDEPGPAARAAG